MSSTNLVDVAGAERSRHAHRLGLIAGLAVVMLTLFAAKEPAHPCGGLASNYIPVLAFELARSPGDLLAIFGTSEPCRSAMLASMDESIRTDTLFYIPAYGAFMVLVFLGWRARSPRLGSFGVYVSLVAALFDYVENFCLMKLMPQLDSTAVWFDLLPWVTGVKWLALGLAAALAGMIFLRSSGRWLWRTPAALICIAALAMTLAAMVAPATFGMRMLDGIAASWFVYLMVAAHGAFARGGPRA